MGKSIKDKLINALQQLIKEGEEIKKTEYPDESGWLWVDSAFYSAWRSKLLTIIDSYGLSCEHIKKSIIAQKSSDYSSVRTLQNHILTLIDCIKNDLIPISTPVEQTFDAVAELENIFNKFHKIARQLRTRHDNRPTLEVNDEYDVQDLLHSLVLLHFDDVRREEWTPSYAGGAVRADFLLKDCQTVIEVKKTRPSMTAKDLGEELIIDREKYKAHPDCKQLYCFVYDPEGRLGNPVGIKRDLEKDNEGYIKIFIKPE